MKRSLYLLFFIYSCTLFAQKDTVVINDYTKVMITTKEGSEEEIVPVTDFEELAQAGFFLHNYPEGAIRICNEGEIYVWINGKLIESVNGCELFDPKRFYQPSQVDTVFISFTPKKSFEQFKCQLVSFEDQEVMKSNVSMVRNVRNSLSEFVIIVFIILLIIFGIMVGYHSSRVKYIIEKTFTFKTNAYEFINTAIASSSSLISVCLLSLVLGFLGIYTEELYWKNSDIPINLFILLVSWLKLSTLVFMIFLLKAVFIGVIANLFEFKGLRNFQMFDFVNFNLFFFIPVSVIVFLEFTFSPTIGAWMPNNFPLVFSIVLIMFLIWFALKFVNHDPRRKLIIISYLCATEIMPAIFLLGWFLK